MIKRVAVALAVLLAAFAVRAEECPKDVPEDATERRALAKKWFAQGEAEARAGYDVEALKAYQCSMNFVPHGFTAYNVAQIAEKTGDLELAITAYGKYLLLVPDAKDATEVNERMDQLRDRLAKIKESEEKAKRAAEPTVSPKPPEPKRMVLEPVEPSEDVSEQAGQRSFWRSKTAGWIGVGTGGALLLGGVLSNFLARGQMDTCRSKYKEGEQSAAESACNNAKPLAYLSYSLIGVGAAVGVAGAVLLFMQPSADSEVAANVLPEGGLALRWSGRF
jgi:tetratricopeptide (TPR) repeat protein